MDTNSIMLDVDTNQELPTPSVQPTASSSGKRKATELNDNSSSDDVVYLSDKKPKPEPFSSSSPAHSSLVKLQGSKLFLSQKAVAPLLQGATSTLKELLDWKVFIGDSENVALLKDGIPDRFWGLLVKLAHESEKTLPNLAKHLRNELLPATTTDDVASSSTSSPYDALSTSNLELLTATLLKRVNYGLTAEDVGLAPEAKIPAGLGIWRWEAKSRAMYLPSESLGPLEARYREREQARQACVALWRNLTPSQRTDILSPPKSSKGKEKATPTSNIEIVVVLNETTDGSSPIKKPKPEHKAEKESSKKVKKEKEKIVDPVKEARLAEKAQKEEEKAERKAAREARNKEKEDKEKKEKEVKQRSAAAMMSFFKKPSESARRSPALKVENDSMSDFDRNFLPFVDKRGVVRAPINRFLLLRNKKLAKAKVKSEEASTSKIPDSDAMDLDVEFMSSTDLLTSFLKTIPASRLPVRAKYSSPAIKSGPIYQSVREVISRSQDAEISGTGDPHRITEELKDGHLFKRKLLQFREDTRPAYFGTWTQTSTTVGPRTPFAQDMNHFDYGYDSGCDWDEEDGEGDDIESLNGGSPKKKRAEGGGGLLDTEDEAESTEDDEDDDDSDASGDGWMVDEDEGERNEEGKRSQSPAVVPGAGEATQEVTFLSAKKGKGKEKEKTKKRKVEKTLAVVKGPFFETTLGVCGWDGFEGYRIQMLNDAPASLDPFAFVAAPPVVSAPSTQHNNSPIIGLGNPNAHHASASASSVPRRISSMLPPPVPSFTSTPSASRANSLSNGSTPINASSFVVNESSNATASSSTSATPKYVPKPFPTAHLPRFLEFVVKSTRAAPLLVAELQEHFKGCNIKKGQFEFELKKRAKRQGRAVDSPWQILNSEP